MNVIETIFVLRRDKIFGYQASLFTVLAKAFAWNYRMLCTEKSYEEE